MNVVSRIVNIAREDLRETYASQGVIRAEQLEEAVSAAAEFCASRVGREVSESEVREAIAALEGAFNILVGASNALTNDEGHEEWLDASLDSISWERWERYRYWLLTDQGRPEAVIKDSLDPVTNRILGLLENPGRPGKWDRRGLVAGQVQSGKTSNYVGLINKALDAGYKLVVVLAGTHDNLRSQTQSRINTGVLGFDSEGNIDGKQVGKRVGVGLVGASNPPVICPTSSAQKGDFNRRMARGVTVLGHTPVVLVVKKNTAILQNLIGWVTGVNKRTNEDGRHVVPNVPLLVIDDEADYASVNTGSVVDKKTGDESDPSATNALIRELLAAFEQSAYVGYTATPFANIYIDPNAVHEDFGGDLFPEHFIVTLPETSAYAGAAKIFGLDEDEAAGVEGLDALPTIRQVGDYETWLPDGHKKTDSPTAELPETLLEAMCSFVLASALKRHRGVSMKHNSMLVHVTRFVDVQAVVAEQIEDQVGRIRNQILYTDAADPEADIWHKLIALYDSDFRPVHEEFRTRGELDRLSLDFIDFEDLVPQIQRVVDELRIRTINGEARDVLDYEENPDGITVIAVGGDKLSRGLTLEGLTTSYYLRASRMYDTLLQMGRWFGYRPGYLDVCRLYTTSQLTRWYTLITGASERLYKEFELMAAINKTPRDFGLRVQNHPDGLMVTAAAKSRRARNVRASFSGATTETILFKEEARERNVLALRNLYRALERGPGARYGEGRLYWRGVPATAVLDFVDAYDGHDGAVRALPRAMAEYIRASLALDMPELTTWDVLIAGKSGGEPFQLDDGVTVEMVERTGIKESMPFILKRLVSTGDEVLPLLGEPARAKRAISKTVDNWRASTRARKKDTPPTGPSAMAERDTRPTSRGYLMVYPLSRVAAGLAADTDPYVGFAIAFPKSENAPSVDYMVNEIYWDLERNAESDSLGDDDD